MIVVAGTRFEHLDLVTVGANYSDILGGDAVGQVIFTPDRVITDRAAHRSVFPEPIVVDLVAGVLSVQLPATDDPQFVPQGWLYKVEERLGSVTGRPPYTISVPYTTVGTLWLTDLAPVDASGGAAVPPPAGAMTASDLLAYSIALGG